MRSVDRRDAPSRSACATCTLPFVLLGYTCLRWPSRFTMSEQLEYKECYRKLAHTSVINMMVLSHDGRRLVTGSDDSTVLVWSTQSGSSLCRIKAHSPVLSLAWVDSSGFLLGCENGRLASVDISEVWYTKPIDPASVLT